MCAERIPLILSSSGRSRCLSIPGIFFRAILAFRSECITQGVDQTVDKTPIGYEQ